MLISNRICQYHWEYARLNKNICRFWDRHRVRFPEKTIQNTETYRKLMQCFALDIFPAFWIYYPGFTDKG